MDDPIAGTPPPADGSAGAGSELEDGPSPRPPADYLAATRDLYRSLGYDDYRWVTSTGPVPWTPIDRPLSACRVTVIGSGGIYRRGQVAFHTRDDTSVRVVPSDVDTGELRTAHFAYDETDATADPNCVFPLDRLAELAADGVIGGLTPEAYGFMGGIYSIRRLLAETAPTLIERCRAQEPDLVLLVPV